MITSVKNFLLRALFILLSIPAFAQEREVKIDTVSEENEFFTIVEELPEFPGGQAKMYEFLAKNIVYPDSARKYNIQGRVVVQFVVYEDGSLHDIRIVKDIGWGCGEEVIRVMKLMPDWKPGRHRGKNVKVRHNLPVRFKLP